MADRAARREGSPVGDDGALADHQNLSVRAARARRRRPAMLGWLAFVVIAFAGGSAIGQPYPTAGVARRAAIVMVAVFSIFAILSEIMFKQLGVGLAVAVLIDATVVGAVLLRSAMTLFRDWNWYLPRSLRSIHRPRRAPPLTVESSHGD
jgi:hypothetical protein